MRLIDLEGDTNFTLQNQSPVKIKSLGFFFSPSLFTLPTASRFSRVGWFSRALVFRSLYYLWEKNGLLVVGYTA